MHKKLLFLGFFFCLVFPAALAQKIEFDENTILFQDRKSNLPVLILKDSIVYKGNPLQKTKYKHTDYPDKLVHYGSYAIEGKTFLVSDGSGPVLEFRNDSIVKSNNNPVFRNQCGSAKFVYKNELYLFGGYGLFTYKNILTKYDAPNSDWIQIQTFGGTFPSERKDCYSYLVNDDLYVFGGLVADADNFPNSKKTDNYVWKLHLPNMSWSKIGEFNLDSLEKNTFLSFTAEGKLYLISTNIYGIIYEVDILNNTIREFREKALLKPTRIYYDAEKKELNAITWLANSNYTFFKMDLKSFLGKPIAKCAFIIPVNEGYFRGFLGFGLGFVVVLILLCYRFRKSLKGLLKPFNGIVYHQEKETFLYKGKSVDSFEAQEKKVLLYLLNRQNQYVSLNELNQLFENNSQVETFSATIKRREQAINSLVLKVSKITGIEERELILQRKNEEDKRIKDIMLFPNLLKRI